MSITLLLSCIALIHNIQSRNFYPYTYDEIILKLERWQSEHPNIFKVYTAKEKYNLFLPDHIECSKRYGKCEHHIIIITNHATWDSSPSRPHVFFSGALHGNERVGPTTLIELCDYLLFEYNNNNKQNLWINYLINNRVIILTPMTNSIGYALSRREEHAKLDPNRDFPYLIDNPSNCMKTIVARTVNEIFREYLIQLAITFHGGMRAISFEWGAPNYNPPKDYSPDHIAQLELVQQMQILGGHLASKGRNNNQLNKWYYPIGTLNKVVYPVKGGMEDWAYGGSWDKESVKPCEPNTYSTYPKEKTIYNDAQLRSFNFLVEASDNKIPKGNWGNIKNDWNDIWDIDNMEFDGHIPRNLRISMFLINSIQPFVMIKKYPNIIPWHPVKSVFMDGMINTRLRQKTKLIHWCVSGAMSIYEYDLLFAMKMKTNHDSNININYIKWETLEFKKNPMWRKNLDLMIDHDQKGKMYKFSIDIETKLTQDLMKQIVVKCESMNNLITMKEGKRYCPIWFSIKVKVDDQWKMNRDLRNYKIIKTYPEGIGPQSHVVNARNMNESEWNMTNNKYSVKSSKWWYAFKPIIMHIYFIYDDEDTQIGTQYFDGGNDIINDKDNNLLIIHEKGNVTSLMSLQFVAVCLCLIGIVGFVFYKKRSKNTIRRHGNKTYQRLSTISII